MRAATKAGVLREPTDQKASETTCLYMLSVKSLVHGMAALFGKKSNSQEYGHFGNEKREGICTAFDILRLESRL